MVSRKMVDFNVGSVFVDLDTGLRNAVVSEVLSSGLDSVRSFIGWKLSLDADSVLVFHRFGGFHLLEAFIGFGFSAGLSFIGGFHLEFFIGGFSLDKVMAHGI